VEIAPQFVPSRSASYNPAHVDTRNNWSFGDAIGRGASLGVQDDRLCGQIVRCVPVLIGLSAVSADFRRSYPVAARRSWKIRRSNTKAR
jgi:hypothetical protein